MKTIQYNTDIHICNCPNQHLLLSGEVCDLCMGVAAGDDGLEEGFANPGNDPFDELYFEALEAYYEDITFAA